MRSLFVRSLLAALVAALTLGVGTIAPEDAEALPPFTLDSVAVFSSAGEIQYTFRGHEYSDDTTWVWWSIGPGPAQDTGTPTRPIAAVAGDDYRPDVALSRGGDGLAVWTNITTVGFEPPACGSAPITHGDVMFSHLDASGLPTTVPIWSAAGDAATAPVDTIDDNPSVAMDVTGRGVAHWTEVHGVRGGPDSCILSQETRQRFAVWDGDSWENEAVIPGSGFAAPYCGSAGSYGACEHISDTTFTARVLDPGTSPQTRQQAIATWMDYVGLELVTCPGPTIVAVPEYWPRYAVWDGNAFTAAATVPTDPSTVGGSPYYFYPIGTHPKLGITGDRSKEADLVFPVKKMTTSDVCMGGGASEIWTARWDDTLGAAGDWVAAFKLEDGLDPDVAQEPDDKAVAVYQVASNPSTKTETTPGSWSATTMIADEIFSTSHTVASLPHDRTVAMWIETGQLRWSENTGSGWSADAGLFMGAIVHLEMAAKPLARWAWLEYGANENSLEGFLVGAGDDLDEMEDVGSGPDLSIVLQADDDGAGGAGLPYRTQVIEDQAAGTVSDLAPDRTTMTEPNMGASGTLDAFIVWAKEQYPADNYALVIWDHGDGWRGVSQDTGSSDGAGSPGDDWLSISELSAGLASVPPELEVLAFDACLMGELEVARQVYGSAPVMVASQDCIAGTGYPYDTMLQALEDNIARDGEMLGDDMVDRYATEYVASTTWTLSAIRLNGDLLDLTGAASALGGGLMTGVDDFNTTMLPADNVQLAIKQARLDTHEPTLNCGRFAGGCAAYDPVVDLRDLTDEISAEPNIDAAYQTAIPTIQTELANVIINEKHGSDHAGGAHGLSIYFPQSESTTSPPTIATDFDSGSTVGTLYAANPIWDPIDLLPAPPGHPLPDQVGFIFTALTSWDEFLFRYYRPVADAGLDPSASVGGNALLDATGSSDADGTVLQRIWDLDLATNTDATDADKDGVDELDDDTDATGTPVLFPCLTVGLFPVRLVVRDDHESIHLIHFNVDDDTAIVNCTAGGPPTGQTFSLARGSSSLIGGTPGGPYKEGDILRIVSGGAPVIAIPCANLGLTNCATSPYRDDVVALSYGTDFSDDLPDDIEFSTGATASGVGGTAVAVEAACTPAEAKGDIFLADITSSPGTNTQFWDDNGAACGTNSGASLGLVSPAPPTHTGDDLDALDRAVTVVDADLNQVPEAPVYFTLDMLSPTRVSLGVTPADVLKTSGGASPTVYASKESLALLGTDTIDALCIDDDGNATLNVGDVVVFSLRAGSPTLMAGMNPNYPAGGSPAALFLPGATLVSAGTLGLMAGDENDAAKCDQIPVSDGDGDGIPDLSDNCPAAMNGAQTNTDRALFLGGATVGGAPLPWDFLGDACDADDDNDAFTDTTETTIGTNPLLHCGFTAGGAPQSETWPPDLVETNSINISDVLALKPVFGTTVPPTAVRYDIVPSASVNISDVLAMKPPFGKSCT